MFTRDNVLHALRFLGITPEGQNNKGWIQVKCINPAHKDDDPSAGFHIPSGVYSCFGCPYTTNLTKIVQDSLGSTYRQAEEFILNNGQAFNILKTNISQKREARYTEKEPETKKVIKETCIESLEFNPLDYYYTSVRGFTPKFCKLFNIEKCTSSNYMDYFIIPIRDSKKGIETFEARKLMQYEFLKKYYKSERSFDNLSEIFKREKKRRNLRLKNFKVYENGTEIIDLYLFYLLQTKVLYPPGAVVNRTIFNIDFLDFSKPLYLVEGIGSVPKIYLQISNNVSCVFGSNISSEQIEYLKNFPEIIIIPDNDLAGLKMIKAIADEIPNSFVIPIGVDDTHPDYIKNIVTSPRFLAQKFWVQNQTGSLDIKKGSNPIYFKRSL